MKIRLGSRGSKLALAQTNYVLERLKMTYPEHEYEIFVIQTKGDHILDKPLDKIGDKGLFVKEIEEKILKKEIDIGIHSMKDMPTDLTDGLIFTKIWKREDARDVLILKGVKCLSELPKHSVIATGSKRRIIQLKQLREDLRFVGIRGNIDTRMRKLKEEPIDGLVLAAAGLHRLGLKGSITQYMSVEELIPAAAQGALALEIRGDDLNLKQMLDGIGDDEDERKIKAERSFLAAVGGSCHIPVGAFCVQENEKLKLIAMLGEEEGDLIYRTVKTGNDPKALGEMAATELLKYFRK